MKIDKELKEIDLKLEKRMEELILLLERKKRLKLIKEALKIIEEIKEK